MKLTKKIRTIVIEKIKSGDQIVDIADAVGVTRQALYWLKLNNDEFGKEWEEAAKIGQLIQLSECEKEADFRGRIGYLEPRFYEGRLCGYVMKYSDSLLQLRLKALAPEKYRDKAEHKHEHSGPGGGAIPHKFEIDWVGADEDEDDGEAGSSEASEAP